MATIPTCNPWTTSPTTIRQSDQIVACRGTTPRAGQYAIEQATFNALVLDCLQRLAAAGIAGFTDLANATQCDIDYNAREAYERTINISLPMQTNTDQQQAYILWALGAALCTLNA